MGIDVDVYDDNVVEGTEKITDQTNEISIQVFIIDNDCKALNSSLQLT